MKKTIALFLAVILTVGILSGCGGKKKGNAGGETNIQIVYWQSGYGDTWLKNAIDAFEDLYPEYTVTYTASASHSSVISAFGMPDVDSNDLYIDIKNYNFHNMEPLDDILDVNAPGDQVPLKDKLNASYLAYEKGGDGHYYTMSYGGGILNMYYNTKLFEQAGIKQFPRTTDELVATCDKLASADIVPMCHFKNEGYYSYMMQLFMAQYDGLDYYLNTFFGCTDENGVSPSKDVFLAKDGRYYALKAFERFLTPEYTLPGSNSMSHTEIQTMFMNNSAAMMLNGSWVVSEMNMDESYDYLSCARIPVLSAIINKMTTVTNDSDLRRVINAVDQVDSGEKQLSDFANGDGYTVDGLDVSTEDWQTIYNARNTLVGNAAQQSMFIPNYSDAKEGAKKFIQYLLSDAGYKSFAETTRCAMPMKLSTGEDLAISGLSSMEQLPFDQWRSAQIYVDLGVSFRHEIFISGGADMLAKVKYVTAMSTNNKDDRKTADKLWEEIEKNVNDKYDGWIDTMKKGD